MFTFVVDNSEMVDVLTFVVLSLTIISLVAINKRTSGTIHYISAYQSRLKVLIWFREYRDKTGFVVGFKPAGGIRWTKLVDGYDN